MSMFKSPKIPKPPSEKEALAERKAEENQAAAKEQLEAKKRQGVLATIRTRGGALGTPMSDSALAPTF